MNDQTRHELVERYLDGHLTPAERLAFEQQLGNDPELSSALALALAARNLVRASGRTEVSKKLDQFEADWQQQKTSGKVMTLFQKYRLGIAAMILIILTVCSWFLFSTSDQSSDLFVTNFEVFRAPNPVRGTETTKQLWDNAVAAYRSQEYQTAAQQFQGVIEENTPINYLAQFYLGVSSLAQQPPNTEKALLAFEEVLKSDNDYRQQASWYKALALIQAKRKEEATVLLRKMQEGNHYKKEAIQQLLIQLDE